jgi:NNMT/PNMT/TEMT family
MPDAFDSADTYRRHFDPRAYLQQYYSLPQLAEDDADLMRALTGWLRESGRTYRDAVDVGCGPTIHNTFAIAEYVEHIDLADFLPGNLAEIRKWLRGEDAHDWDPLFRGVLACDGQGPEKLAARKELYRSCVRELLHCDLRTDEPLGSARTYDLVTSFFFFAECVASTKEQWRAIMERLLKLVRPGGSVFLATVRNCSRYAVLDGWIPATPVVEEDLTAALIGNGFDPGSIRVDAFWAPD